MVDDQHWFELVNISSDTGSSGSSRQRAVKRSSSILILCFAVSGWKVVGRLCIPDEQSATCPVC